MDTHEDNLEFAVSQAVDGTLTDLDRHTLGERLHAGDAPVWAADHERLNAFLRAHAERPDVDYDSFADAFSATLAAEDGYVPASIPIHGTATATTWTRRFAAAAAVMLTALAAWPFLPHRGGPNPQTVGTGEAGFGGQAVVQISAPTAMPATAPAMTIAVGPSETLVKKGMQAGLGAQPTAPASPKVVISGVATPGDARPY